MSSLKRKSAVALAWDFGGLLINRGSGFIISIFLARILSPEEFGLVGMAMVFIAISQVFIDVGFASALIQRKENSNLAYSSVFYFNLFSGIILTAVFYFIAPFIGGFYDNIEISRIVRWLSLSFLFNSLNQVQSAILTKQLNFKVLTIRNVIASTIAGVLGVIAAYQGLGVYALVTQSLSGALISTILLWSISSWKPSLFFSFKELKGLMGFSAYVFFDRLVSTVFNKLDVLIIAKVFSPATLGFYSRAVSLKDQVSTYSTGSIQKVFFPVLSKLQDKPKEYSRIYFKVISVVSFISYFLTGILYVTGEHIIINLFGSKWEPSVEIFQILILSVCLYPLNAMMVNAFMSRGFSKVNFRIGLLRKFFRIIPLVFAYYFGLYEFIIAVVLTSYFLTVVNMFFLRNYFKLSIKKHLIKIFEGSIPLIILIVCYHYFELYSFILSAITSIIFGLVYIVFNKVLKTEGYIFIQENTLKQYENWKLKRK